MLFTLNNIDYTANIIADSYKINSQPVYESYEDAKGRTHNVLIRNKVSGSFDMFFRTMTEYNEFLSDWNAGKSQLLNTHTVYLNPNNINEDGVYQCFLKHEATRRLDGRYREYVGQITVSVEER